LDFNGNGSDSPFGDFQILNTNFGKIGIFTTISKSHWRQCPHWPDLWSDQL